ncbi:hypothetical protein ACFVRR_17620 [Gottfriedia sp. NPDC057948]|uniref:hypothetical protein n=1 Tax=Gottfriedia sp. NPDC057948 TaxID=3346287 RepID=UPI0036DA83DE
MVERLLAFAIDFISAAIPLLIIAWLITLIFKKYRKEFLVGAVSLALLSSLTQLYKSFGNNDKLTNVETSKKSSQKSIVFTDEEKGRIERIIIGIQQDDPSFLTKDVHKEFWSILESQGELSKKEIADLKDAYTSATRDMQYFYEDALISLNSGEPFISEKRK